MRESGNRRGVLAALADAMLVPECVFCGLALGRHERGFGSCEHCRLALPGRLARRCRRCGLRADARAACVDCFAGAPAFDRTVTVCDYAPPVDRALLALKHRAAFGLARPFGALLAECAIATRTDDHGNDALWPTTLGDPVVVPIPLAPRRLAQRGYNQAALLARECARRLGLRCDPRMLARIRETAPQSAADRATRLANLDGAFGLRRVSAPAVVVLVDDVMTTGATMDEAARALKRGGAQDVTAMVVARTPDIGTRVDRVPPRQGR